MRPSKRAQRRPHPPPLIYRSIYTQSLPSDSETTLTNSEQLQSSPTMMAPLLVLPIYRTVALTSQWTTSRCTMTALVAIWIVGRRLSMHRRHQMKVPHCFRGMSAYFRPRLPSSPPTIS
jgi:hypothetical protein